jgi:hypothetical protein
VVAKPPVALGPSSSGKKGGWLYACLLPSGAVWWWDL